MSTILSVRYSTIVPATVNNHSDFAQVQRDLDETISKLKAARDPEARKRLLRDMRRLLVEADRILD